MEKKNIRIIAVLSLVGVFFIAIALMSITFFKTNAESTVSATSVFTTSGGASSVSDTQVLTYSLGDEEGGDAVTYRRNLALKWYSADAESSTPVSGEVQYFTLTIGFEEVNFTEFKVALETTQLSMSKAGKTVNTLTFTPDGNGGLSIAVNGVQETVSIAAADIGSIEIRFGAASQDGAFTVYVNDEAAGVFTNIGKDYAKYASSTSSTPLTPLTFTASTEEEIVFVIRSMNGQSFALDEEGKIVDDVAPVLVVDSEIKRLVLGTTFSFDTVSIDVCSSSVTTSKYYLANATADDIVFADSGNVDTSAFTGWTSTTKYFFDDDFTDEDGTVPDKMSVSIAISLTDGNGNTTVVLVEWYGDYSGNAGYGIPVVRPEGTTVRPETSFYEIEYDDGGAIASVIGTSDIETYQTAVTAATTDEEGAQIQVGSGAYFYIPSLKSYVSDTTCGYTDMEFVVYYKTQSSSTSSSTYDYDGLCIEVSEEGTYQFCVIPKNAAGKVMAGIFEDGNGGYYEAEITSDNVWEALNVATFSFTLTYNGPSVEAPSDEPDIGYVDVTYTFDSFVTMATSNARTQYTLYVLTLNEGVTATLAEVRKADQNGYIADDAEGATAEGMIGYWTKIEVYDSELDDDEGDNPYNWNPTSSLSFVPQGIGYYKLVLQVADGNYPVASASQIINVTAEADILPGLTQWLQNNWMSVMFLCIGGACLIAIVVLLLIKPKGKVPAAASAASGASAAEPTDAAVKEESLKDKRKKRK